LQPQQTPNFEQNERRARPERRRAGPIYPQSAASTSRVARQKATTNMSG